MMNIGYFCIIYGSSYYIYFLYLLALKMGICSICIERDKQDLRQAQQKHCHQKNITSENDQDQKVNDKLDQHVDEDQNSLISEEKDSFIEATRVIVSHYSTVKVEAPKLTFQSSPVKQVGKEKIDPNLQQKLQKRISQKSARSQEQVNESDAGNLQQTEVDNECPAQWQKGRFVDQCCISLLGKTGQTNSKQLQDTRYLNSELVKYPYNCIGLLIGRRFKDRSKSMMQQVVGTGFLIAANLVLTAAHNVAKRQKFSFKFYPKLHGKIIDNEEKYEVIDFKYPKSYRHGCDASQDFAILKLSQAVPRNKYIMIGQDYPKYSRARIYGYPMDKIIMKQNQPLSEGIYSQYGGEGSILKFSNQSIYYNIDTQNGQSGSPVIVAFIDGLYFVVGIHCKFSPDDQLNLGCHLSNAKVGVIKGWMEEIAPESQNNIVDFSKINQLPQIYSPKLIKSKSEIAQIDLYLRRIYAQKSKMEVSDRLRWLLVQTGKKFRMCGDFDASFNCLKESVQVCEKIYSKDCMQIGIIYNQIGITLAAKNKYVQALKYYLQASQIFKNCAKQEHAAIAMNNIGNCYVQMNQLKEAQQCYSIAFQINKKYFKTHPEKFSIYSTNLGKIYLKNGKYDEAEKLYKEALRIQINRQKYDLERSKCYFNLAQCHINQEKFSESIEQHYLALKIMIDLRLTKHQRFAKYIEGFKFALTTIQNGKKEVKMQALKVIQFLQKYDKQFTRLKQQIKLQV